MNVLHNDIDNNTIYDTGTNHPNFEMKKSDLLIKFAPKLCEIIENRIESQSLPSSLVPRFANRRLRAELLPNPIAYLSIPKE